MTGIEKYELLVIKQLLVELKIDFNTFEYQILFHQIGCETFSGAVSKVPQISHVSAKIIEKQTEIFGLR